MAEKSKQTKMVYAHNIGTVCCWST